MRIGVTGASGMLGSALIARLSRHYKIFATSRNQGIESKSINWDCFDLTDLELLNKWLDKVKPDVVIHCAAIVNVDLCEENSNLATQLHYKTTKVMANYLNQNNGKLIYISTDSVFDGEKQSAYRESDLTAPLNVYARTKLMGEEQVKLMKRGLVLRTNIVGWTQDGKTSFFEWMLESLINNAPLNLFNDVIFSPLNVHDLSFIIEKIINKPVFGLYHCASSDSISKYDFGKKMAEIFQLSDLNINRVSVDSMKFKANRPKNMALDVKKIGLALECNLPSAIDVIKLMKYQYDKNNNLLN